MALDVVPPHSDLKLRNPLECYMRFRCDSLRLHKHVIFDAYRIVSVLIRGRYGNGCREITPEASISRA